MGLLKEIGYLESMKINQLKEWSKTIEILVNLKIQSKEVGKL